MEDGVKSCECASRSSKRRLQVMPHLPRNVVDPITGGAAVSVRQGFSQGVTVASSVRAPVDEDVVLYYWGWIHHVLLIFILYIMSLGKFALHGRCSSTVGGFPNLDASRNGPFSTRGLGSRHWEGRAFDGFKRRISRIIFNLFDDHGNVRHDMKKYNGPLPSWSILWKKLIHAGKYTRAQMAKKFNLRLAEL